jgi:hypothetical protein
MRWLLAASSLLLASCWAPDDQCDLECNPDVTVDAHVALPETALSGATLTFCQNNLCGSSVLPELAAGDDSPNPTNGALYASVEVSDFDNSGATDPTTSWLHIDLEDVTFNDGDVYTLTVTDPSGATLYAKTIVISQYQTVSVCASTCNEAKITL